MFDLHAPAGEGPGGELLPFGVPIPADMAEWLQAILAGSFLPGFRLQRCDAREFSADPRNLCLRAEGRVGKEPRTLFVRILPPWDGEKRRQVEAIQDYLLGQGCRIAHGSPSLADPATGVVVADSWIPGARVQVTAGEFHAFEPVPADRVSLRSVGAALGGLHVALAGLPIRGTIRENRERFVIRMESSLDRLRRAVRSGDFSAWGPYGSWGARNSPFLARLASDYRPDFRLWPDLDSQPVHGDAHGGNLLRCEGEIWFLDFEDAVHSHFPRWADAAMTIQRLLLKGDPDREWVGPMLRAFLEGYETAAPSIFSVRDRSRGSQLAEMMSQLAYRSVCVLLAAWLGEGIDFGSREWDKFVRLERQAREYAATFREALD